MGVMSCSRKDCESIMVDTYVDGCGYVCYECQEEFKVFVNTRMINIYNGEYCKEVLNEFLTTSKNNYPIADGFNINGFFEEYTE